MKPTMPQAAMRPYGFAATNRAAEWMNREPNFAPCGRSLPAGSG
jgi:hypothetical protein